MEVKEVKEVVNHRHRLCLSLLLGVLEVEVMRVKEVETHPPRLKGPEVKEETFPSPPIQRKDREKEGDPDCQNRPTSKTHIHHS